MNLQVIFFITTLSLVLLGTHAFLYYSVVKFFKLSSAAAKTTLLFSLLLLAASFVGSSILVRYQENLFAKVFYGISGIWIGLLINLLMACLVIWLLRFVFVNNRILTILIFVSALFYTTYGVWNALHPQIKNVEVTIKNLPQVWQGKKIIQLSDVHIGALHGQKFLTNIIEKINAQNAELVLITGDLFDGMDGANGLPELLDTINTTQGVYFVTGNHEIYFGLEKALAMLNQTKIKNLNDASVDLNGLQITGVSYPAEPNFNGKKDLKKEMESQVSFVKGKPTILLYHSPTNIGEARSAGVNLQLSGHTHQGQIFPFRFITRFLYDGYDYGLVTDGDYNIYTTNGAGTWGPPIRTGNTPEIVVITLN